MSTDLFEQLVHQYGKSRQLFVITASGLYHVKSNLQEQLPPMHTNTSDKKLKLSFSKIQASLDLELHRIRAMLMLLQSEVLAPHLAMLAGLDLDDYLLSSNEENHDVKTDWMFICQLMLIEAVEYQAFQVLLLIAEKLDDQQLVALVNHSIRDSEMNTSMLKRLLKEKLD